MLPDFPKVKKNLHKKLIMPTFEAMRLSDPLLARIKHFRQFEGKSHDYETVEKKKKNQPYEKFSVQYEITVDDVTSGNMDKIMEKVKEMGENASSQMAKYSFKEIDKSIEEVGNTIDEKGKPFTKETFIRAIEKIEIDFDFETGQASLPTFYIHPNMKDAVQKAIGEAEKDPDHKRRFDEIIERKRKEWNDREASRKLVD